MKEYKYNINGNDYTVRVEGIEDCIATVYVNGESYTVKLPEPEKPAPRPSITPVSAPQTSTPKKYSVKAPLPGVIIEVVVKPGDEIKRGQTVAILDAMKMENNIVSEKAGIVAQICVQPGESILEGTDLVVFE